MSKFQYDILMKLIPMNSTREQINILKSILQIYIIMYASNMKPKIQLVILKNCVPK